MSADLIVLLLALGLEMAIGDPVSRWHPVAMFGRLAAVVLRYAPREGRVRPFVSGGLIVLLGAGSVAGGSALILAGLGALSPIMALVAGAVLLKTSFSYRQLEREAVGIARSLETSDCVAARGSLRALVSRDTSELPSSLIVSATIESLAENLSDSFVAPVLYFALFGVPGALAYRAINTLDAMIGYHGVYEYLGRVAARADDVANLVPARVTALLLVVAAALIRLHWRGALTIAKRDHARTESPNAGWPMAAMAGALGIQLEKTDHYRLGEAGAERSPALIGQAIRALRCAAIVVVLVAAISVAR